MALVEDRLEAEVRTGQIKLHGPEGFEGMRRAGRLAAECLDMLTPHVRAGVTTLELDRLSREFTLDHGALPACLFYRGYNHTICTSLNHVVCHGIPGDRALREGDIVNIDITVIVDGWHGDHSRMYAIGKVSRPPRRLIDVTYEGLARGIAAVKPGARLGDVGHAIQSYVEAQRCSVVRDFCGHGVGRVFHDAPEHPALWPRWHGRGAETRHVLHHRAHGEPRPSPGETPRRRLDGGDAGQVALGPVRAFDRGYRDRV